MKRGGFTLVEIILSLTITAVIGVLVYDVLWAGMGLDRRLRWAHENYMEVLLADQVLGKDLENAIHLDYSQNYPDLKVFAGGPKELGFLTVTAAGIKHVRYYAGRPQKEKTMGFMKNSSGPKAPPVEYLLRQESGLADWANGVEAPAQIVAGGLKQGTFACRYAPYSTEIAVTGADAVSYQDQWDQAGLPMAVRCSFDLYDPRRPAVQITLRRDFFLAPTWLTDRVQ